MSEDCDYISTATQLIRQIDPSDIELIRKIFQGNLINLEQFSSVLITMIPKKYQINEDAIECLARAIIDLFEELDSDNDGSVTFQDFITYYKDSSTTISLQLNQKPRSSNTVFSAVQKPSNATSGKTGVIVVESIFQNGGEFTDLPGKYIVSFVIYLEQYYLVTDAGLFSVDNLFKFPKLIWAPTLQNLELARPKKPYKLDNREKQRREKEAFYQLAKMGLKVGNKRYIDSTYQYVLKRDYILNQIYPLNSDSKITCCCLLDPYPYIVLCCETPIFIIIRLNGNYGFSDIIKLSCKASSCCFDKQLSRLYLGLDNGAICSFDIAEQKQEVVDTRLERQYNEEYQRIAALWQLANQKDFKNLSKEDLILLYPELYNCLFQSYDKNDTTNLKQQLADQKYQVQKILQLKDYDIEIIDIITEKIFNTSVSITDSHHLDYQQIISEDPAAFLEIAGQPNATERAQRYQRHGNCHLSLDITFYKQKFVLSCSCKYLCCGRGQWEDYLPNANHLRLVASSSEGSVYIFDEDLNQIAAFADLQPEGIVGLHVVGDDITSVGYHNVYYIHREAVYHAHYGQEDNRFNALEIIDAKQELIPNADLTQARNQVSFIQPPRPNIPILTSIYFGDIIGVVDHDNILTLFQSETGAHISRIPLKIQNLLMLKFGYAAYSRQKEKCFMVAGKYIFALSAVSNESLHNDGAVWDIIEQQHKRLNLALNDYQQLDSENGLPIASIGKEVGDFCVNQATGEVAVITGNMEITIISLLTGSPVRIVNVSKLLPEMLEDKNYSTEYNTMESNDTAMQLQNTHYMKPLPQKLNNLQNDNIINILGNQILNIEVDIKGRIMFIIGTVGIITVYWKSAQLFDMSQVGILGRSENKDGGCNDTGAFLHNQGEPPNIKLFQHLRLENDKVVQNNYCYSLKINFASLLKGAYYNNSVEKIQRKQIICSNKRKNYLFVIDSLNPQQLYVISTSNSPEYISSPLNSRVLEAIDSTQSLTDRDALFNEKQGLYNYFASKEIVNGNTDFVIQYYNMAKYFPRQMSLNKQLKAPQAGNAYLHVLEQAIACSNASGVITTMATSNYHFLIAIGTSDGRIIIVDGSTQKFIRYGTIMLPHLLEPAAVTCLYFLDYYPLIFSADANSNCYLHTIRPFEPSSMLVCSWRHSNYWPVAFPLNMDFKQGCEGLHAQIISSTSQHVITTNGYIRNSYIRKQIYQYLYYKYLPDSKFWGAFYGQELPQDVEKKLKLIQSSYSVKQFYKQRQLSRQQADNVQCSNASYNGHHFVNLKQQISEEKVKDAARPSQQALETQLQLEQYKLVAQEIFQLITLGNASAGAFTQSFQSFASVNSTAKRQKKRKTESKILSVVVALQIAIGPFGMLLRGKGALKLRYYIPPQQRVLTVEDYIQENNIQFRRRGPKTIDVSDQTKKFIRFYQKGIKQQQPEDTQIVRCDSPVMNEVLQNELKGILFKYVNVNGQDFDVPIRKESVDQLSLAAHVNSALFLDERQQLLLGDENGFITCYSLKEVIGALGCKGIRMITRQVAGASSTSPGEVVIGMEQQNLPAELQQDAACQASQPLLSARKLIVQYHYKAHQRAVTDIIKLIDTPQIITIGQDNRIIAWQSQDASLLGMVQRIQLPAPPQEELTYFGNIYQIPRHKILMSQKQALFTIRDMNPNLFFSQDYVPPVCRYEAPPAAAYEWKVQLSDITRRTGVFRQNNIDTSIKQENYIDYCKSLLMKDQQTVYFSDLYSNFFKATGMTEERALRNRDSWTVQALIARSQGKL